MVYIDWCLHPFHSFSIFVSDNRTDWGNAVLSTHLVGGRLGYTFPPQTKRYIKCVNDQEDANWWGFWNFSVFNTAGSTEIDTGDNVNIALNKTITGGSNGNLIVDGNLSNSGTFENMILDLGASYSIARMFIKSDANGSGFHTTISSSDDNKTWTPRQNINMLGENIVYANYSARYLKFEAPNLNHGSSWATPNFNEIEIYKTGKPTSVTKLHAVKNESMGRTKANLGNAFSATGRKFSGSQKQSQVKVQLFQPR